MFRCCELPHSPPILTPLYQGHTVRAQVSAFLRESAATAVHVIKALRVLHRTPADVRDDTSRPAQTPHNQGSKLVVQCRHLHTCIDFLHTDMSPTHACLPLPGTPLQQNCHSHDQRTNIQHNGERIASQVSSSLQPHADDTCRRASASAAGAVLSSVH